MKRALVIRYGALGDGIIASCCLPYLHRDGYRITVNGSPQVLSMLRRNPYVYRTIPHKRDSVEPSKLEEHWAKMGEGFDKVVNLTGTMENSHIFAFPQPEYYKCLKWRRFRSWHVNWYDNQVFRAGYVPDKPSMGELYFGPEENRTARKFLNKFGRDKYFVLWALSGSSVHKVYRHFELVGRAILAMARNTILITAGSYDGKLLTFDHERCVNLPQMEKSFRFSACLTKYVDLVIGPETGLLNAAGCFDTPKICFLTHSSKENLAKYWKNDHSMQADTYCSPCYLLHKYAGIWKNHCQVNELWLPKCIDSPSPKTLIEKIQELYDERFQAKSEDDAFRGRSDGGPEVQHPGWAG